MKNWALGLVLAASAGTAMAADPADLRTYESNDYAARVYYRMDFSGDGRQMQSLGLRFDNERAMASGAPSLFLASFGEAGLQKLAVSGVDFRGAMLSANQSAGGSFWSSLTPAQWLGLGFTALVFTTVAVDASDSGDPEVTGTGSGSGGG
jgi:hypothetical protein